MSSSQIAIRQISMPPMSSWAFTYCSILLFVVIESGRNSNQLPVSDDSQIYINNSLAHVAPVYKIRAFSQAILQNTLYHVLAMSPFPLSSIGGTILVNGKAVSEARKADSVDQWLGYPRVAYPDVTPCQAENNLHACTVCTGSETLKDNQQFICCDVGGTCITSFQAAVYSLLANPLGGYGYWPASLPRTQPNLWSWNGPATGGTTISVFGMGFGWNGQKCSPSCLQSPDSVEDCGPLDQFPCTSVSIQVGSTTADPTFVSWFSDSSLNFKLPPGQGASLDIQVSAMQVQTSAILQGIFSYDAPTISKAIPANAPPSGQTVITLIGQNFASDPSTFGTGQIKFGQTNCDTVQWTADSAITCQSLVPGTGAFNDVAVSVISPFGSGRASVVPFSRSFSYDRPVLTALYPTNGPPSSDGLTAVITILGLNFGVGQRVAPQTESACPQNAPTGCSFQTVGATACTSYYLFSPEVLSVLLPGVVPPPSRCTSGFSAQFNANANSQTEISWNNIRPHSLAFDPVGCALNTYVCDQYQQLCKYIPDSCKSLSNRTLPLGPTNQRWCIIPYGDDILGSQSNAILCKLPRVTPGFTPDGINCFSNLSTANSFLCSLSPRLQQDCSCLGLGCCNNRGTTGARFGTEPPYGLGGTECITLTWLSDSSLRCRMPPGIGHGHTIMLAVDDDSSQQLAVLPISFSYDAPLATGLLPVAPLFETSGATSVLMLGSNFGTFECNSTWCSFEPIDFCPPDGCNPPTARSVDCCRLPKSTGAAVASAYGYNLATGYSVCQLTDWVSDSAVFCNSPAGLGDMRLIQLTIFRSTFYNPIIDMPEYVVGYKPPYAMSIQPTVMPAAREGTVTISGQNFGLWDSSPKARIAGTSCITTAWQSDSVMLCKVPPGLYAAGCTATQCCTPSGVCIGNNPCDNCANGGTGSGWDFVGNSPAAVHGCAWAYDTFKAESDTVGLEKYQGQCGSVVVTVNLQRSQLTRVFSYEPPLVTRLNPSNGPTTGQQNITIGGSNFGTENDNGYQGSIGDTSCEPLQWTSDSSLTCSLQKGYNLALPAKVQIAKNGLKVPDSMVLFSFDAPVVSLLIPSSIPTSGDVSVTIFGSNFGAFDQFQYPRSLPPLPPDSTVGDTPCPETTWLSDSSLVCKLTGPNGQQGPGVGGQWPVEVQFGVQVGVSEAFMSYKAPVVIMSSSGNGPAKGGKEILINGDNFGVYDYSPEVSIGITASCTTYLAGGNKELPIEIQLGMSDNVGSLQTGFLINYFTYDDIVLVPYTISDVEVDVLAYIASVVLAAIFIFIVHLRVRKAGTFTPELTTLPERYARATPGRQANIRPNASLLAPENADGNESEDEWGFYENEKEDLKNRVTEKEAMDEAFRRGVNAVMNLDKGRRHENNGIGAEIDALLGSEGHEEGEMNVWQVDVATGKTFLTSPKDNSRPTGQIDIADDLELEDTPAPKRLAGARR